MDPTNGDDKLLLFLSDLVVKRGRGWMILAEKAILVYINNANNKEKGGECVCIYIYVH